jgi:putative spermidine/putrescine transport system substrate-binding protein
MTELSRRSLLGAAGAAPFAGLRIANAQGGSLIATTYPGSWETAHRQFLVPAFTRATGASVALQPVLALEAITRVGASRNAPPYDAIVLDEGPYLAALQQDIFAELPPGKLRNLADLPPAFIDPNGKGAFVSAQIMGLTYNPKKIRTPPTSWLDLWKPEFRGRVGITGLGSSLGSAWLVEVAKLHGGSESNLEPGFTAIKALLPNVSAIAPNPGALATLFQQEQIDISFNYHNSIMALAERGVDVAMARPDTGWVLIRNTMHVIKNSRNFDLACAWIDAALSPEVQAGLAGAPNWMPPTNRKVAFGEELRRVAPDNAALSALRVIDWATINPVRSALIERFNREIRL